MKNFYFLLVLLVGLGLGSCKNQDDIYMEFVKKGGNVYPAVSYTHLDVYKRQSECRSQ